MSTTQINNRVPGQNVSDVRTGAVALVVLRLTLVGVGLALLGTVAHVVLKLVQG